MKKLIALLVLTCMLTLTFTSCVNTEGLDVLDSIPEVSIGEESETVSGDDTSDPATQEGYTDMPKITQVINITASRICIAGTCAPGATIKVVGNQIEAETKSDTGYFIMEVNLVSPGNTLLECTATVDGLLESTPRFVTAQYMATVSERKDGYAVTIGQNNQLFLQNTLDDFCGNTLLTITQLNQIKQNVNDTYDSMQTARLNNLISNYQNELVVANGGEPLTEEQLAASEVYVAENLFVEIPYIFVLIPSAITVYPELAPESVVSETYSTRYSQIVRALKETKATVIDMNEIFEGHKGDQYPLYGTNDSYWTEYGAYLAYCEIMDIVDDRYPIAAARPLSDFNVEAREIMGGDMVGYLYLDRNNIRQTTVTLTPKFELPFTTNVYVSDDDRTLSYVADETRLASFIRKRNLDNGKTGDWPNALVVRDEWSAQMYSMLAERFNGVIYALGYTTGETIEEGGANPFAPRRVDINYIKTELQPDYVISIVSEVNLGVCFGVNN